jgi:serine/threonine protein kinase
MAAPADKQVLVASQLLGALPSWSQARCLYEKGSLLGAGSFAKVFASQVIATKRPVALKQVSIHKAGSVGQAGDEQVAVDPVDAAREVLALQALSDPHPNIIQTHDIFFDAQHVRLVIASESCRGSLKQHLDSCMGIIPKEMVQLFTLHMLRGLAHCHDPRA